jgi:hypothetical protein
MVDDLGGGWIGFSPDDESAPSEIRQRALEHRARKPAATVTFMVFSDEGGDCEAGFDIDPDGVYSGVEGTSAERRDAFLRLSKALKRTTDDLVEIFLGGERGSHP